MKDVVDKALKTSGPVFVEIFTDTEQVWEPKSSTKRLEDGTLVSPPLEDLEKNIKFEIPIYRRLFDK